MAYRFQNKQQQSDQKFVEHEINYHTLNHLSIMKIFIFTPQRAFLMLLLLFASSLVAWKTPPPPFRNVSNAAFNKGEFLKYRVHYGVITAGYATLEVGGKTETVNGRKCHHIIGKGFTTSSYDWVYKIRDKYETFVDEEALIPWRFIRHIEEGDFKSHTETRFEHSLKKAYHVNNKAQMTAYNVPENIQDVISSFYYARTLNQKTLQVGSKIPLTNFLDEKTFNLQAQLLKRENVSIDGVKYKALKMKLLVEEAGIITDGSKINFWISDDENKIPLRIEAELAIGSIKVDLIEYKNLKNAFSAKLN